MTHKLDINAAQELINTPIWDLCAPGGILQDMSSMMFYKVSGSPVRCCCIKTNSGVTLDVYYDPQGNLLGVWLCTAGTKTGFGCRWFQEGFKVRSYLWPIRELGSREAFHHIEQSIVDYHRLL
jgi:hypothetical protein